MRVLWCSLETPDRDGQGGQRRQFHQIVALQARGHDITVLVPTGGQDDTRIRTIAPVLRPRTHVRGRRYLPGMLRLRRIVGAERWEAIVVSHHLSARLLPHRVHAPVLVDVHNVLSDWHRRRGREADAERERASEEAAIDRADMLATCSPTETARLVAVHPSAAGRTITAPIGVDPAEWPAQDFDRTQPRVALFGSWMWEPNRRGLGWFAAEVWPRVVALVPDAQAQVAGSGVLPLSAAGLAAVGRVPDLAAFTAGATVVAVPVRDGVGAAMKFVESLATGAAVVATPDAATAAPESGAFVSADADEWAAWIADRLRRRAVEPAPSPLRAHALQSLRWSDTVAPIDRWLRAQTVKGA